MYVARDGLVLHPESQLATFTLQSWLSTGEGIDWLASILANNSLCIVFCDANPLEALIWRLQGTVLRSVTA